MPSEQPSPTPSPPNAGAAPRCPGDGPRRFTWRANAFGERVEDRTRTVATRIVRLNSVRIRPSLRVAPAMAASVTDKLWSMPDAVALPGARGTPPKGGAAACSTSRQR